MNTSTSVSVSAANSSSFFLHQNFITSRELEVLQLLSTGNSRKEISDSLFISFYTVNDHVKSLLRKLEARNAAHLVRKGFVNKLL